jgi:K(+)-stimulated pyrophosphate-energized sodium pump
LNALRRGTWATSILAAGAAFLIIKWMGADLGVFWPILSGLVAGVLIGESTNFFTSYVYSPTLNIAKASQTRRRHQHHLWFCLRPDEHPARYIIVAIAVILAYKFGGHLRRGRGRHRMLSTLGIQDATDAYGRWPTTPAASWKCPACP